MTEQRPIQLTPVGALRFNTDSAKLEYFDGNQYVNITTDSPQQQTGSTRGFRTGGYKASPYSNVIDLINIDTTGNAIDFGDLTQNYASTGQGFASRTRGFHASAYTSTYDNTIEFWIISSSGNAVNFGDMLARQQGIGALSDSTRGIINAGYDASLANAVNTISYVTMSTTGDALDFGDLSVTRSYARGCASPTRGVNIGGYPPGGGGSQVIDFTTISTLGNAADFGEISYGGKGSMNVSSNAVRGILAGGGPSAVNNIDFITIATLGDSKEFGDLTRGTLTDAAAMASSTRWVVAGGGSSNTIEYVQIMTLGNTVDFGDLTQAISECSGCSSGHGGLG